MHTRTYTQRSLDTFLPIALVLFGITAAARPAAAEGSAQTGLNQGLPAQWLRVDIIDSQTETIEWNGNGSVQVRTPDGTDLGTFASGEVITPSSGVNGAYLLGLESDQFETDENGYITSFHEWDVAVSISGVEQPGRVWSRRWDFDAGGFTDARATDASFFALVPGGDDDTDAVVELKLDGLAGYRYMIVANRAGPVLEDGTTGLSVPVPAGTTLPAQSEYRIYLNPPASASYGTLTPTVDAFDFNGWQGAEEGSCTAIVPGSSGAFAFSTNVNGTYHIVCDLNGDGEFNVVDLLDLHLIGSTGAGANSIDWDGLDNADTAVAAGTYECSLRVTVGEFHYLAYDIETSYPGLRIYEVDSVGARTPLRMFWNDMLVQASAITMRNGDTSAETSGADGVDSGAYDAPSEPHGESTSGNARAWGSFFDNNNMELLGKGDDALLDTFAWVDDAVSSTIEVEVLDGDLDTDSDTLPDYVERCTLGTNPEAADSDGDTIPDSVEAVGGQPIDTDNDGLIDALDDDSDDDNVPDAIEAGDDDPSTPPIDSDGDGVSDYADEDDDDDGIPTAFEDPDGDLDPTNDDTDGDGTLNYLDDDDDGDGVPTIDEDSDNDGDPTNDDTDGDGVADYLDDDDDNDGIPTVREDPDGDGDVTNDDSDEDGTPDYLDDDDDGDGVPTQDEDVNGNGNWTDDDSDGDGVADFLDGDDSDGPLGDPDGDGVANESDNCSAVQNADQADLDEDGVGDACDDDADGDSVPAESDCDDLDATAAASATYYPDEDGDGVGVEDGAQELCRPADGYVQSAGDNCPAVANADQADGDQDGFGDACDACLEQSGQLDGCPPNAAGSVPRKGCASASSPTAVGAITLLLLLGRVRVRRKRDRTR